MRPINLLPCREQPAKHKRVALLFLYFATLVLNVLLIVFFKILISHQLQKLNAYKDQLIEQLSVVALAIEKLQQNKQRYDSLRCSLSRLVENG
jgi:Tfp pilus assembly protein PilN